MKLKKTKLSNKEYPTYGSERLFHIEKDNYETAWKMLLAAVFSSGIASWETKKLADLITYCELEAPCGIGTTILSSKDSEATTKKAKELIIENLGFEIVPKKVGS